MLQLLDYSVEFPTTGRSFQNRLEFAPGLTAITGRNEAGKTIVLEMIGYCLFGKGALRGLSSDYKNLSATLALRVGEQDILIQRAKKETLTVDGEVTAVGAEAINKAVPALLGFGLEVFNIACAAQQGDLGALTEMRPTARRQMVDQLIGLDLLEGIEKECKGEAKAQDTLAMALLTSTAVPQEPVKPDDYEPSADLEQKLRQVQVHEAERAALAGVREPVKPTEPVAPEFTDVAALEAEEIVRQEKLRLKASLEGKLQGMPEPRFSREDLDRAVAYDRYQSELRQRGPMPDYSTEQLDRFYDVLDAQKAAGNEVECPKCDHHFHPGLTDEQEQLLAYGCPLTRREVDEQCARDKRWAEPLDEVAEFTIPDLNKEILAHAYADDRASVLDQLGDVVIPADRSGDLRAARDYQQSLAIYGERIARYDAELATYVDAQSRLDGMDERAGEVVDLQRRLGDARAFESAAQRYDVEQARYDELSQRARDARELADGYGRGSAALKAARVKVKQELAPSLSKAASSLLYAMTSGERRFVDVDHDFNISVDGQPLQTLSGSGKSVVNLALRIGLGQVLTSKVLPIFMGDEIDKDMDAIRASSTHGTFQNLKAVLTQIILVTHKEIEADQVIQL